MNAPTRLPEAENNQSELADLVSRVQDGDHEVFGELVSRFEQHVLVIAIKRLGNFHEAKDLVQDVFIQAFEKIGQLREPEAFAGWLRSITMNMARNHIRQTMRRRRVLSFMDEVGGEPLSLRSHDDTEPIHSLLIEEARQQCRDGLECLSEVDYRTLELFYIEDNSINEMVEILGAEEGRNMPKGTIKRRLYVARKRLESVLQDEIGSDF